MTSRLRRHRLQRKLFTGQVLVILVGAATLGIVAFLIAPPIFQDHVRRAVGPVSDTVAHHLDAALSETLFLALAIGILASAAAAAGVSWLLATRIARPIEHLSRTADAIASGRHHARAPQPATDDELGDLAATFNRMADRLEHTEETRRRLLADLAHELRTPLATIEAYHEGLTDGVVDADVETRAILEDATGRLRRLVDDVALVSRAEEGQLAFELGPLEVGELVRTAVESVLPRASAKGVEVRCELPDRPLPTVGDRDRLVQVLTNLLDNALEHTPSGGCVTATGRPAEGGVRIEVTDTGVGIGPEDLPHVFQRFYRADPSRHRVGGSGIGLTISRAIVHGHGGELTARSDGPGRGATFTIDLLGGPAGSGGRGQA